MGLSVGVPGALYGIIVSLSVLVAVAVFAGFVCTLPPDDPEDLGKIAAPNAHMIMAFMLSQGLCFATLCAGGLGALIGGWRSVAR